MRCGLLDRYSLGARQTEYCQIDPNRYSIEQKVVLNQRKVREKSAIWGQNDDSAAISG
jgi:hypothetical protein